MSFSSPPWVPRVRARTFLTRPRTKNITSKVAKLIPSCRLLVMSGMDDEPAPDLVGLLGGIITNWTEPPTRRSCWAPMIGEKPPA